jgi:hypothetical protein
MNNKQYAISLPVVALSVFDMSMKLNARNVYCYHILCKRKGKQKRKSGPEAVCISYIFTKETKLKTVFISRISLDYYIFQPSLAVKIGLMIQKIRAQIMIKV